MSATIIGDKKTSVNLILFLYLSVLPFLPAVATDTLSRSVAVDSGQPDVLPASQAIHRYKYRAVPSARLFG